MPAVRQQGARIAVVLVGIGLAGPALAVPIVGTYGNSDGCEFFNTGNARAGAMQLLTGESLLLDTAGCDFVDLVSQSDAGLEISAVCSGDAHAGLDAVTLTGTKAAGYTISINGVGSTGPLLPCPGSPGQMVLPEVRT